jgi:hypothetical protein
MQLHCKALNTIFSGSAPRELSDLTSLSRAVPALRFPNGSSSLAYNFIKFDGVENGFTLVDRKMSLTSFAKQIYTFGRTERALAQNLGYNVMYEFPTQRAADAGEWVLRKFNFDKVITTRAAK